jgi:hypothetical protein
MHIYVYMPEFNMTDAAIQNARSQRDEYLERIKKLEQSIARTKGQLVEINKFINLWEKFNSKSVHQSDPVDDTPETPKVRHRVRTLSPPANLKNPKKEEINQHVESLLDSDLVAVSRAELYKRLVDSGVEIQGTNPEMILSTMLWRMQGKSDVVRSKGGGYILKKNLQDDLEIDESAPLRTDDDSLDFL